MRENGLLAPHRALRTEAKLHDGTIVTDKVNEMWGTDRRKRKEWKLSASCICGVSTSTLSAA